MKRLEQDAPMYVHGFRARFARVSHEAILLKIVIGIFAKCD